MYEIKERMRRDAFKWTVLEEMSKRRRKDLVDSTTHT
jgi:hypothetical protein